MAETGLQRSVTSFRRQGSSGMVWDDKALAGLWDQNQNENQNQEGAKDNQNQQGVGPSGTLERSRSAGARPYRTVNVAPPSVDPPSPKVATCGFCGFLGKPSSATRESNPKSKRRR